MSRVEIEIKDHIAQVTLTRADKMNAVDQAMIDAVIAAAEEVAASDARAVVLSGDGPCFCAGIDIAGLGALVGQDPVELLMPRTHGNGTTNQWQEMVMAWTRLDIPVIAALHGPVFGAGLQLALGADIRIAAHDAQLAVMEMKWGLVPDMGGMALLPRLVGTDVMRLLTYTAEPIDAAAALGWGLVTKLADDPKAAALALAETIAGKSPKAMRLAKELIDLSAQASEADILLAESRLQTKLMGTPEQMEVIAAHFAKRPAVFT